MSCKAASWKLCWKKVGDFTIYAKTSKQNCCLKNMQDMSKKKKQIIGFKFHPLHDTG